MSWSLLVTLVITSLGLWPAQARLATPAGPPPSVSEVRQRMGIPSTDELRGQMDTVGFAANAEQMAAVWKLSEEPPAPEAFAPLPPAGVAAVICPHDDYLYAGRVYRKVLPLLTARTVVAIGVFHRYRQFGAHDFLVFDPYRAWRTPDGELPISPLRERLLASLAAGDAVQDAAMHDSEHSVEALAYWLHHARPDMALLPILVPAGSLARLDELAQRLARALATIMREQGWQLGRDLAIAISADGVHYGPDFDHTPFGAGGVEAYVKACEGDRALLTGPLSGPLSQEKIEALFATFVDPADPSRYRLTWCGRFSIPFGLLLLAHTARALELPPPQGHAVAYATSVGWPELPVRQLGLGETAPANLYHFVSYPAVAYTVAAGGQP